ncbi:DUF6538 domain-containing protein [Ruegeria arenilitoris]|uniref:DUF6538 domain-containing protein n=1 Tax=Ruegeria arenilitoris TaxID=1173585 RepID=UPI0034644863
MRRGRIFYFRKRLPKKISNQVPDQFLCLSLRTDLPQAARIARNQSTVISSYSNRLTRVE